MYFTLIEPAPGHEQIAARERAVGAYEDHRWLWQFFPAEAGSPRDFLFRRLDSESKPRYYVVSKRPATVVGDAWRMQARNYEPRLSRDEHLRFELRANPVVTRGERGNSKRHDVVMQAKKSLLGARGLSRWQDWHDEDKPSLYDLVFQSCGKWLMDRSERLGFRLTESMLSVDAYKQDRGKKGALRFSTVDFSGTLIVTDPQTLTSTLYEGIGHAKAFGCGLLLVRRV